MSYSISTLQNSTKPSVQEPNMVQSEWYDYTEAKFARVALQEMVDMSDSLIQESTGLIIVNEGLKEILLQYIQKIKDGILKAFDKIKEIIEQKQNETLKRYKEYLDKETEEPDFTITAYKNYDTVKLQNGYVVQPLDYEGMKEALSKSKEEFIKTNYPNCYEQDVSIKDKIMKDITGTPTETRATVQLLEELLNFCLEGYENVFRSIENDKNTIDASCQAMQTIANNTIINDTEPTPKPEGGTQESVVYEAEDNEKVGFKDDPDAKKKNLSPMKVFGTWCSVVTSIYSAKIRCLNTIRSEYYKILMHHARLRGWDLKPEKQET